MKIIEKIKIKHKIDKLRVIKILGIPILYYKKNNQGKSIKFKWEFSKNTKVSRDKICFYLKVHNDDETMYRCLQNWIDVVDAINGDYFIICDSDKLKSKIMRKIFFPDLNIKFIKSQRKKLEKVISKLTTGFWGNAGCAHATTFYHAAENGIKEFWNIDADDTMILFKPNTVAQILEKVQDYAKNNKIEIFSLDMWRSRTRNKAWTFGVTYIQNPIKFIDIFNKETGVWKKDYEGFDNALNIDWYITYLKNSGKVKAESFYIENSSFIHFGPTRNFLTNIIGSYICNWQNNKLTFPIIVEIYKNKELGIIPISKECVKFDLGLNLEDSVQFQKDILIQQYPAVLRKLWCLESSGKN